MFLTLEDPVGALATAHVLERLGQPLPPQLGESLAALPEEVQRSLLEDPEAVRQQAVAAVRERFAASGGDVFAPPVPSAETRSQDGTLG